MRILIEAHHPGDIHFWKYPVRALLDRGHRVHMVGRDRDVMRQLLEIYDWIPHEIPNRRSRENRFPLRELIERQFYVAMAINRFRPDVVASLFGSYAQSSALMGVRNVIFTDSEFQHFNHRIAHPFASQIHTPYCFYKPLGRKQVFYNGIHELSFLGDGAFKPNPSVLEETGLTPRQYIVLRLSAWNTFHDIHHEGIGKRAIDFVSRFRNQWQIVISAEENKLPDALRPYAMQVHPSYFHDLLAYARFVLTEGASTASEAACLGVPTVYINSTEPRGYLQMLEERYGLVRNFRDPEYGMRHAYQWLNALDAESLEQHQEARHEMINDHPDVCARIVDAVTGNNRL
jgi:predicted glycosyltransferase